MIDLSNEEVFIGESLKFLKEIFSRLQECKLDIENWSIDHLCYRVETRKRYEECKKQISKHSKLLIESDVNGRPISTFKLVKPIVYRERFIELLELPAPKEDKKNSEGFEHIEVIAKKSFEKIMIENPHCVFDQSGLSKNFNPELKLKLGDLEVKFHYQSLESVINLEKNSDVFQALIQSEVLDKFHDLSPVIAGTFPLGIYGEKSDLDILMESSDLENLRRRVRESYGHKDEFIDKFCEVRGVRSYVANFTENSIPIEIFGQVTPSVEQTAFQHFQIEEQLLKVGSEKFLKQIKLLRKSGEKTEPAFAKALHLLGDPFEALLEFNHRSDQNLYEYIIQTNVGGK